MRVSVCGGGGGGGRLSLYAYFRFCCLVMIHSEGGGLGDIDILFMIIPNRCRDLIFCPSFSFIMSGQLGGSRFYGRRSCS